MVNYFQFDMSHRWKIFIAVATVLLIFTVIWLTTMHWQPENAVDAYRKSLLAKGEKLEINEVVPPPVPPESNAVEVVRTAFSLFAPSADDYSNLPPMMFAIAPGKAMVGWMQPEIDTGWMTNSWSNVIAAVEENRPATEMLWQVMNYPAIDFQLDYNKASELLLPHLAPLKRSAQRLTAAAMVDLRNGNSAAAATNICALLAIVHGDQDERLLISQLVRIAMAQIAASATWEFLQATNLTDAELALLQTNWERLEFMQGTENSMLMERVEAEMLIKKMRASNEYLNKVTMGFSGMSGSGSSSAPSDWLDDLKEQLSDVRFAGAKMMWRTSWTYSDELRMLQQDQIILETIRTIKTNQFFNPVYSNMDARLSSMGITNNAIDDWLVADGPNLRNFFSEWAQIGPSIMRKTMAVEVTKHVVVTAIALKRFQLKHGNFPEKLSELSPEFLASVPPDPVDGKPLRYRRNADGTYLLYSIGENGNDDGGDASLGHSITSTTFFWQRSHALDWVWPQPATKEEIHVYLDSQKHDD